MEQRSSLRMILGSKHVGAILSVLSEILRKCICWLIIKVILFYKLCPRSRNVLTLPHTMLSHYLLCICFICVLCHSNFSFLLCHQKFLRISSHSLGRRHVVFFNHHTLPFLSLITHHLANNISITLKAGDTASLCNFIITVWIRKTN